MVGIDSDDTAPPFTEMVWLPDGDVEPDLLR